MNQLPAIRMTREPAPPSMAAAALAALMLAGLFAGAAAAAVNTWQGTTTAWATPGNWSLNAVPNATHDVVIDGGGTAQPTLDFNVSGGPGVTIASLTVGETAAATQTFHNGNVTDKRLIVTGNVAVGTNGVLTHTANSSAETHRLFLDIGGDLSLAAGGSTHADFRGYYGDNGPGYHATAISHGGSGGEVSGLTYGTCFAPVNLGSGGRQSSYRSYGGGAIRLTVAGLTTLDGVISANGQSAGYSRGGAGGSIFLTTGRLTGSGTMRVNGGNGSYCSGSGGGRIAVILTEGTDFGAVTMTAYGGNLHLFGYHGAGGTVFVRSPALPWGRVTVNSDKVTSAFTPFPPETNAVPSEIERAILSLTNRANARLTADLDVGDILIYTPGYLTLGEYGLFVKRLEHDLSDPSVSGPNNTDRVDRYERIVWLDRGSVMWIR